MIQSIGARVKKLRTHYNLGVKDFAARCGISHVAVFNLENERTLNPHRRSLQRIADAFGTTPDWLLFGTHDMLPHGVKEVHFERLQRDSPWKDEIYHELKQRNALLEKELERLWQVVHHFTGGSKPDFQRMRDIG